MPIIIRNMAKAPLEEEHRDLVLSMYYYVNRDNQQVQNYIYKNGIAYLPLNPRKLEIVSRITGQELQDERSKGDPIQEPFTLLPSFTFREHQELPAYQLLEFAKNGGYGLLKAQCGAGKTVTMTWVAGMLGMKTLVLVDQGNLAGQWKQAFENIVWGKRAAILSSSADLSADVVIATFQFLNRHPEIVAQMRDMFGTCLLDECHTNPAKTFKSVIFRLNNYVRLGTSATVMRKGYSSETITDIIGDVAVEMKDDKALIPEIHFVTSGSKFCSDNPDDFATILSQLAEDEGRAEVVLGIIKQCLQENRKILVIGMRIEALKRMGDLIASFGKPRVYVGSTTLKQDQALRDDLASGKINVIITDKKAEKGLDLPELDTVILAKPMNNEATVQQIVGRILRSCEGKPVPVVYDIVDGGSLAQRFAKNRRKWYQRNKYVIAGGDNFLLDTPW